MAESVPQPVLSDEATLSDELGRGRFVETLKQVLLEAETPLVVAIYGPWGAGKTSMMMQLRAALAGSTGGPRPQLRTVWFVPWEHSRDHQPGVSLLLAIRRDLGLENVRVVDRALRAIALAITDDVRIPYIGLSVGGVRASYRQLAEQDVERRSAQALLREHFKKVIAAARESEGGQQKLVIFIDDLDRCQPGTAIAMMEALKLYLSLAGCIFVLGIDPELIQSAIASEYASLGIAKESYLNKIVQLPFTIPALSREEVNAYVAAHLARHLRNCQQILTLAAPDNPRLLKRIINTLLLLDRIADISFPNRDSRILCAVAVMQNSAPDLYQHLRRKPEDWAVVVPAGIDPQVPSARPGWLEAMLSGSDTREALSAALVLLRGLLGSSSAGVVDITPYIGLSEQVSGGPAAAGPPESRETPERLNQQAAARIDEAIPFYEQALRDRERELGRDNPETLVAQSNLANAYQAAGRVDKALALYRETHANMVRVLGADDPETLAAQSNLASACQAAGLTDEAIRLYELAVEGMSRVIGADHPNTLTAKENLAASYQKAGRIDRAISLYQQAHDGMSRVMGPDHPSTLAVGSKLADAYLAAGRVDQAITLNESIVAGMTPALGADHPATQAAMAGLRSARQQRRAL
jgi:tetratricopeptide (TPR) repeat protein